MQQITQSPELFGDYPTITLYDFDLSNVAWKNPFTQNLFANAEYLRLWLMMFSTVEAFHGLLMECKCLKHLDLIEPLTKFKRSPELAVDKMPGHKLDELFLQFGYGCKIDWCDIYELIPMEASTIRLVVSRGEEHEQRKFMDYVLQHPEVQAKIKNLELGYLCDNELYNDIFEMVSKMSELRLTTFTRSQGMFLNLQVVNRFLNQQSHSLTCLTLEVNEPKESLDLIVQQLVNLEDFTFGLNCNCLDLICRCFEVMSTCRKLKTVYIKFYGIRHDTARHVSIKLLGLRQLREFVFSGKIQVSSQRHIHSVELLLEVDESVPLEVFNLYRITVTNPIWRIICTKIPRLKELKFDYLDEQLRRFEYTHDQLTGLGNLQHLNLDGPLHLSDDVIKIAEQTPSLRFLTFRSYYEDETLLLEAALNSLYNLCPLLVSIEIGPTAFDRCENTKSFIMCESRMTDYRFRAQAFNFVNWDDM